MTDLDKLITGQGGDIIPKDITKGFEEIGETLGDIGAAIGDVVGLLASLLLPQQHTVFKRKERVVVIPATFKVVRRTTRTDLEETEFQQLLALDREIQLSFKQRARLEELTVGKLEEVLDVAEHKETVFDDVEDSGRSFLVSSWKAFKVWSSIPLLQMVAVAAVGVPLAAGVAASVPVVVEKLLPEVIDVVQQ